MNPGTKAVNDYLDGLAADWNHSLLMDYPPPAWADEKTLRILEATGRIPKRDTGVRDAINAYLQSRPPAVFPGHPQGPQSAPDTPAPGVTRNRLRIIGDHLSPLIDAALTEAKGDHRAALALLYEWATEQKGALIGTTADGAIKVTGLANPVSRRALRKRVSRARVQMGT